MQKSIEQTLTSREVAEMIEKVHSELLKDIRRYLGQFNEGKIPYVDFFQEGTYTDAKGETRPCYRITKKGCEFIAHKLTGVKGTIFTARYINRFHEMEDMMDEQKIQKEFTQMQKEVREQKKMLENINHRLSYGGIIGLGYTSQQVVYKREILKLVEQINDIKVLRGIYTVAKYIQE